MSKIDIPWFLWNTEGMPAQNISITPELLAHVHQMVESGKFANVSEYMRALVRHDLERHEHNQRLAALIKEGEMSGKPVEVTPEGLGALVQKGIDRAQAQDGRKAG